jgi:hypothetical protein
MIGPFDQPDKLDGVFVGKIKNNIDIYGMGTLEVYIKEFAGNEDESQNWRKVRYCPPFAGSSNHQSEKPAKGSVEYEETDHSYGIWHIPPDLNVLVLCAFLNGDSNLGVWWACLPHDDKTHALPGVASGATHEGLVKPIGERNRFNTSDKNTHHRPEHPASLRLSEQGVDKDLRRGQSNAGPFRDATAHPGLAYGMLSPNQHSFMLDDGADQKSGEIRLRTSSGHQIQMHEEGGYINIMNAKGNAWIELDEEGNIDIYSEKDISFHAEENINFHAGANINAEATKDISVKSKEHTRIETGESYNVTATKGLFQTSDTSMDVNVKTIYKETATRIDMNGPVAAKASKPEIHNHIVNELVGESISQRVPEHEPWAGHAKFEGGEKITLPVGAIGPDSPDAVLRSIPGSPTVTPAPSSYEKLEPIQNAEGELVSQQTGIPVTADAVTCIPSLNLKNVVMSEKAFNMMKSREAYRGVMYADFQGYSVGYGTRVDIWGPQNPASKLDANIKQALVDGPSEPEARIASRQIIDRHMTPPLRRRLIKRIGSATVCITQTMFDALCMASFGNPSNAYKMADKLVDSGKNSGDGKPQHKDIATIWANAFYTPNAGQRNAEAKYAMTGEVTGTAKTADDLRVAGVNSDSRSFAKKRMRQPAGNWKTGLGNGPSTGKRLQSKYLPPNALQKAQFERSYFLNTGNPPPGSSTTQVASLQTKHGNPHTGENNPPNTPTRA